MKTKIKQLINNIALFVDEQGTLVQEEGFEQVPVHHMTTRDLAVDGDVVLYVGAKGVFCESGSKYLYTELDVLEVIELCDYFNIELDDIYLRDRYIVTDKNGEIYFDNSGKIQDDFLELKEVEKYIDLNSDKELNYKKVVDTICPDSGIIDTNFFL